METVKYETCPKCSSADVKNNIYLKDRNTIMVYVECAKCGCFVARYTVKRYTSNKTYESLLQYLRNERLPGSRRAAKTIEEFSTTVEETFEHIKELRQSKDEKRKVEEIISETENTD